MNTYNIIGVLLIVFGFPVFFIGSLVTVGGDEVIGPHYPIMALGIGMIATGTYLYYLGHKKGRRASQPSQSASD